MCHCVLPEAFETSMVTGYSFITDESPPEKPRYCGLRFQITFVYLLFYRPVHDWESKDWDSAYPFVRHRYMCDIMHAPGKTGADTLKVIDKQTSSLGLNRFQCVNGVGDGGGENEGSAGVHALLELDNHSYVRRRCFGHLPWRVADAGLDAMGDRHKKLLAISAHLRDGTTWTRCKALAVQTVSTGGLALLEDGSSEFHALFSVGPPRVLDERPETAWLFLAWLLPRQHHLSTLLLADQNLRNLSSRHAILATASMQSPSDCVCRFVDYIMLHKALYLFHRIKVKPYIADSDDISFADLVERACQTIMSCELDENTWKLLEAALGKGDGVGVRGI